MLEEISHKLSGASFFFFEIRCQGWFWSIHLDTPSSYLTTFNTHKGQYKFLCKPFGLKMLQDMFQMCMDQITDSQASLLYMMTYVSMAKHKNNNKQQISHWPTTDHLLWYHFSAQGMKPNPMKIQALQDLPTPQTQKQLQSFLGLVNYLQPFLPGIASKTIFLHEQI